MKKVILSILTTLIILVAGINVAHADLNSFLLDLNNQAKADIARFNTTLSAQFHLPLPQIESIVKTVKHPADAFMCLKLSQMTGIHFEKVIQSYNVNNKNGWGVIAKELGIKPGSPAFHALKKGDFIFPDMQQKGKKYNKDKTKGKGKGKGKKK